MKYSVKRSRIILIFSVIPTGSLNIKITEAKLLRQTLTVLDVQFFFKYFMSGIIPTRVRPIGAPFVYKKNCREKKTERGFLAVV